jgi:predicted DNA-binding protein YlxM (UPF0122 family)
MKGEKLKEMVRLYREEEWTLQQIGDHYGVTRQAVFDRFKRAGIKMRSHLQGVRPKRVFDKETLIDLYVDKKLLMSEIAKELKTSRKTLAGEFKRHRIKKHSLPSPKRKHQELYQLKVGERFIIKRPDVKNPYRNLHAKAFHIHIKISVKNIGDDNFQVTRIK